MMWSYQTGKGQARNRQASRWCGNYTFFSRWKNVLSRAIPKATRKNIIEIPAGKMEPGEDPLVTAKRELEEETGFQSDDLTYLTSFYTSPGFASELLYIYVARDLRKMEHPLAQDADEFINLVKVTLEEAEQLIAQQCIHDAKTMYAIQYWKMQLLIEENE